MKRTLGLDLGTNSIGWAIITEVNGKKYINAHDPEESIGHNPVLAGSVIFSEGVARVKGHEVPSVSTRTGAMEEGRHLPKRRWLHLLVHVEPLRVACEGTTRETDAVGVGAHLLPHRATPRFPEQSQGR